MLPSLCVRTLWRMILVTCFAALLVVGCGSDSEPAAAGDASADTSREGAAGAGGNDASDQDIGSDSVGNVDAGHDDAMLDTSTVDAIKTSDAGAGDAADANGTTDVSNGDVADAADQMDARDVSSDAIPDAGASDAGLEIVTGGTYGPYVVHAIAITGAPAANYTFAIASPIDGTVSLRRDGTPVKSVAYNWQTTVSATDPGMFYTFDFPGYLTITIRKAGSGTTNLYEMDQSIFDSVHFLVVTPGADGSTADGGTIPVNAGGTYAPYVVESIGMAGAPDGAYTFHVTSPTAGSVELRRDGNPVTTISYVWQTTVSATDPGMFYTFDFVGYFSITIRKAGTGTMNLYAMDQSIFDGAHVLAVMNDGGSGG